MRIQDELYEAQQRSMQRLLEAWQKEIEAQEVRFRALQQKHAQQDVSDQIETAAAERYLHGQIIQALAGADISISIPAGVNVACDLTQAAVDAELKVILARALESGQIHDQAQHSVLWSLANGYMPHPSDVASLLQQRGLDADWSTRFAGLGQSLDASKNTLGATSAQFHASHDHLSALKSTVNVLQSYPPDRLLNLALDPRNVIGPVGARPPAELPKYAQPKIGAARLDRILNALL